jgi:Tfp pilus assembly protein PilZ
MSTIATSDGSKKSARAALVGLDDAAVSLLRDCFQQFHIEATPLNGDPVEQLKREKFEACVLRLNPQAKSVLEAARSFDSNRRMIVYGVCDSVQEAIRYSRYGINAVIQEKAFPAGDRKAVLKVVEATHRLVINELRRFIRIPIVTDVTVEHDGQRYSTYSQEISAGGISIQGAPKLQIGASVQISFLLLDMPQVTVRAKASWVKPPDEVGLRFDLNDEHRLPVCAWVEKYLEAN